jgi:hypothetical protein
MAEQAAEQRGRGLHDGKAEGEGERARSLRVIGRGLSRRLHQHRVDAGARALALDLEALHPQALVALEHGEPVDEGVEAGLALDLQAVAAGLQRGRGRGSWRRPGRPRAAPGRGPLGRSGRAGGESVAASCTCSSWASAPGQAAGQAPRSLRLQSSRLTTRPTSTTTPAASTSRRSAG